MSDACGELAQRGEFLGLDQPVLCGTQFLQRQREFAGARLNLVEQPGILDRDRRLIGERHNELDLLVGERSHLGAQQCKDADCRSLALHRHAKHGAVIGDLLPFDKGVVGIGLHIGNMDDGAFKQRSSDRGAALRFDGKIPNQIDELL